MLVEMGSKVLSYGAGPEATPLYKLAVSDPSQKFRGLHLSHRRMLAIAASKGTSRTQSAEAHDAASPLLTRSVSEAHNPQPTKETEFFSTTGTPPVSMKQWNLNDQHLFLLSTIACVTGGAVTALFVAAIPALLAFKRAAESLEKLLEVTREELPGTMAAVRLSGMEISDLTMELSELGQEISSGMKSSARAVRAAQDGLRRVSSIASMGESSSPAGRVSEANSGSGSKGSS